MTIKEHGLLLSGPMVRAHIAKRKRMTRRVLTNYNTVGNVKSSHCDLAEAWVDGGPSPAGNPGPYLKAPVVLDHRGKTHDTDGVLVAATQIVERIYPRYRVGDRIWWRETFFDFGPFAGQDETPLEDRVEYRATPWERKGDPELAGGWTPSIHMPRWAARFVSLITKIRIERVQDITEDDARAEGVPPNWLGDMEGFEPDKHGWLTPAGLKNVDTGEDCDENMTVRGELAYTFTAREAFEHWWDNLNGHRGYPWKVNPWVIVLEYEDLAA